jgi:hypothetical protein
MRPWESVPATPARKGRRHPLQQRPVRGLASARSFAPARPDRAAQKRLRAAERALLVGGPGERHIRA